EPAPAVSQTKHLLTSCNDNKKTGNCFPVLYLSHGYYSLKSFTVCVASSIINLTTYMPFLNLLRLSCNLFCPAINIPVSACTWYPRELLMITWNLPPAFG